MKTYKSFTKEKEIIVAEKNAEFQKAKITSSRDAADYIRQFYNTDIEIYESFFILLMNKSNNTIGFAKISSGGVAVCAVDVKLIAKFAVDTLSSSIILAHNHPSGNTQPSQNDIALTRTAKEALKLFDISVLDHVILTEDSYYSFTDEGVMP